MALGDWTGHSLPVAADRYLPITADFTPNGQIATAAGTDHDITTARRSAPQQPPLDTCFCLGDGRGPLRDAPVLRDQSGIAMTVATTEPGIQVYDSRAARRPGRGSCEGLAIEPQAWPDAPNHPAFPSILLTPDAPYHQTSEWRFTTP